MDVTPPSPTIRARVLRFLVLALALLLALLGAAAAEQLAAYRNAAAAADNARLELLLQGLVHELQKERGLTVGYLGGGRPFGALLPAQRRATDAARARLGRALRSREDPGARSVRRALGRLDGLARIRRRADDGTGGIEDTFGRLTNVITVLGRLRPGPDDVYDARLRAACQALQVLGDAKEFLGEERAIVLGSVPAGRFRPDGYGRFLQIRAGRLAALESFPRSATGAQQRRLDAALTTPDAERALAYERVAVHGDGRLDARDIPPMSWWRSLSSTIDGLRDVQISLGRDIEGRAAALEGAARCDLLLFVLFALGTVVTLGHLTLDCVRSVSTPLAVLARQTREAAGTRLPRAVAAVRDGTPGEMPGPLVPLTVPDRAGAEVRDVAEAFERVQRLAFELATEQAVLRRTTESLLVVAEETAPRPRSTPQSVTDVLRAALTEAGEYRRVSLRRIEPVHIIGTVVTETARLLAELVEKAVSHSPPGSGIAIEGTRTGSGYLVVIVGHGPDRRAPAAAGAQMGRSGTSGFPAGTAQFLGDFAVGAFARTGGTEVRLAHAPSAGVVARVLIPASLLAEPPAPRKATTVAATEPVSPKPASPKPVLPVPRAATEDARALVSGPALPRTP